MNNEQNNTGTINPSDGIMPNIEPNMAGPMGMTDANEMTTATVEPEVPTETPVSDGVTPEVTPIESTPEVAPAMPDVVGMPEDMTSASADTPAPEVVSADAMAPEVAPMSDTAAIPMPDASIAPGAAMPENSGTELTLDPALTTPAAIQPYKEPEEEEPKKKVKAPLLITLIIVLIIALGVAAFAAYIFLFVKPAKIHSEVITQFFNNANTYITSSMTEEEKYETLKQVGHMTFETNMEQLKTLNNYSIDYTLGVNPSKNVALMDLSLLEKNSSILGGTVYMLEDGIYFQGEKIYDGILKIGDATFNISDLYNSENKLTKEEVTYILNAYKNYLIKSFDESKYERKLTTEKINNKSQKVFNNYYVINEATSYQMAKSILESLKADSKALEIMAKSTGETVADLTSGIDSAISSLTAPELTGSTDVYSFNVYTSIVTNEVLAVKIYDGTSVIFEYYNDNGTANYNFSFEGLDIVATKKGTVTTIKAVYDHDPVLDITINRPNENSYTATINIAMSGLFAEDGLNDDNLIINISSEKTDKETNSKFAISLMSGEESLDFTINNKLTTVLNEAVNGIDTNSAVYYQEVDSEEVRNNIMKSLEGTDLYNILTGGSGELPETPETPNKPETPTPEIPDEPEKPNENDKKYDEMCYTDACKELKDCNGTECTCTYSTGSFSTLQYHDITCPKK